MNKLLPLGVITSLLLTGCGGSSGGGGGSTPAPQKYTWQFVQMKELNETGIKQLCGNSNPTIFSADKSDDDSAKWVYTVGVKAPDITGIFIYNSDGTLYTEGSLTKHNVHQKEGTLTFTENDIPDGGYIAVIDDGNGIDNVLVVQKEALVDGMIKVNRNQGQQQCYTGNELAAEANKKKINIGSPSGVVATNVETYFDGKTLPDNGTLKENLTVLNTAESVLLSGYDAYGEINSFAYIDKSQLSNWNTPPANTTNIFLEDLRVTGVKRYIDVINSLPGDFNKLTLKSMYKGNTFEWFAWPQYSDSFEAWAPLNSAYGYTAFYEGQFNGWDVVINQPISEDHTRIDLASLDMKSTAPAFECSGSTCSLKMSEITDQSVSISELKFSEGSARYTVFASGSDITVPHISGIDYPTQSTSMKTSFLLASDNNTELTQAFYVLGNTKNYQPSEEYIEMFLPPALDIKHHETLTKNQYTYFSR